eukprot:933181-Alexandrium_andersonii.AAC.1
MERVDEVEPSKLPEPRKQARGAFQDGRLMPEILLPRAEPRVLPEQATRVLPEAVSYTHLRAHETSAHL